MARKRMLDPNIWVSEDVSMLSIFARLMFIGMISNADDEGKGRANASYLKSTIFPYDEDISTRKVNDALKAISEHCSVELYTVGDKKYYRFKNWRNWQKVEKPMPSQIPNPTDEQSENNRGIVGEQSGNSRGTIDDESRLIRIRKEKEIESITHTKKARACESACIDNNTLNVFINNTGLSGVYQVDNFDYNLVASEINKSKNFLKGVTSFDFFVQNYKKVVSGFYRDFKQNLNGSEYDALLEG